MSTWNTRGLRGSTLEDFINLSIEKYRESGIALIHTDSNTAGKNEWGLADYPCIF